jgi:hypothetical protein
VDLGGRLAPKIETGRRCKPRRHQQFSRHRLRRNLKQSAVASPAAIESSAAIAIVKTGLRRISVTSIFCGVPVIRWFVCHPSVRLSSDGLSSARRSVYHPQSVCHPTVCLSSDGLSITQRSACHTTVCLSSNGLSATQRSVCHPTVCLSPDGLSVARRSVLHLAVCLSPDNLSVA